jgi:D-threo-aldose 1-dehydrogenase
MGTALRLSRLGLGAAPIGNLLRALDDETAAETVRAAYDVGMRFFDTAPHYGLGLSERRLGAALAGLPRGTYTVSTKVGRLLVPDDNGGTDEAHGFRVAATRRRVWDFSRDGVLRSLEASLERLGLDRVDILLIHDPDDHLRAGLDEAYPAVAELRAAGVVDAVGVGTTRADVAEAFVREVEPDVILLAGRFTLLEQGAAETLLPLCLERGVPVINAGVFNSGLLATNRPDGTATYEYTAVRPDVLARAQALAERCAAHGVSLPAAALHFAAAHPAVVSVLVGCHTADQVRANVALFDTPVPAGTLAAIVA